MLLLRQRRAEMEENAAYGSLCEFFFFVDVQFVTRRQHYLVVFVCKWAESLQEL